MCQIKVVLQEKQNEELVMENVTRLEVKEGGLLLTSLFEGPKEVERVRVASIDFMEGTVSLARM